MPTLTETSVKICTVGMLLRIAGHGTVVVTREARKAVLLPLCVGQVMELRRRDGTRRAVTLKSVEMVNFGSSRTVDETPVAFRLDGVAGTQISESDELWTVPTPSPATG